MTGRYDALSWPPDDDTKRTAEGGARAFIDKLADNTDFLQ